MSGRRGRGYDRLSEPDVILPAQFLPGARQQMTEERRLRIAVLEDAIDCFQKHLFATKERDRQLFREAEQWIIDTDRRPPFSFEQICEVLRLDPDYLRRGLRRWLQEELARNRPIVGPCANTGS